MTDFKFDLDQYLNIYDGALQESDSEIIARDFETVGNTLRSVLGMPKYEKQRCEYCCRKKSNIYSVLIRESENAEYDPIPKLICSDCLPHLNGHFKYC